MSISQMTLTWQLSTSPTQKLVLLSLADNANDAGECYPSIAQIATRTCLSERAVRQTIRALEAMGLVRSQTRCGTSTVYFLSLENAIEGQLPRHEMPPGSTFTPAPAAPQGGTSCPPECAAPRQEMPPSPAPAAPPPRHVLPPGGASPAPKPSLNHQYNRQLTVKPRARAKAKALADREVLLAIPLPDWLPVQAWADWVDHRIAVKSPMTQRAAELSIRHLEKLRTDGQDPVQVIEQSVRSGKWTDLYPLREPRQNTLPNRHMAPAADEHWAFALAR